MNTSTNLKEGGHVSVKNSVLVVDDEESMKEAYKMLLEDKFELYLSSSVREALSVLNAKQIDIILLDIMMPEMDGLAGLQKIKKISDAEVIMVTAIKTVKTAIEAVKLGAYDYISKPFDVDDLLATIEKALEKRELTKEVTYLRSELGKDSYVNMVGKSEVMQKLFSTISEVGKNQSTVLITGDSGTGKELVARAIHGVSARKDMSFVAVDCATIPSNLFESELFGHEKGAFTDATGQKTGKFELANGGTLFLDEIGNLGTDIQCKILRVLEEREIQRLGGNKTIKIDTRILAATNTDLARAVKEKRFREDLYYRLNVIPVAVPRLCERREDIPLLTDYFIKMYNRRFNKSVKGITEEGMGSFMAYDWPGNVRELKNIIERLVALISNETVISHKKLPLDIVMYEKEKPRASNFDKISLRNAREEFEKQFILKVLEKVNWNQSKAASLLGIHRNALIYKIRLFNLQPFLKESRTKTRDKNQ
ncbi:MAG: sigma-54-dependent Fis family transcriptional regulator [Endomicrobiales bacterium]|nr:sigma-54-dependent Fis family transcriptional regulator [Endomicrobiales bacterium]